MALGLLVFGFADLVRWSPEPVSPRRAVIAIAVGVAGSVTLAALGGATVTQAFAVAAGSLVVLGVWVGCDYPPSTVRLSGVQLAWVGAVLFALFAFSGSVDSISGPLESWYEQLGLGFVDSVAVNQFVLGVSAALFMTASGNRVVRLLLDQAGVSLKNESDVPGGRVLGPLERLIVFAIVLAGDPAAAAIVITGKGLLRFPEIRRDSEKPGPDARTEYFLIGTFASLVIAALLAVLVLATG
jgi:hypothetical protein